MTRKQLKENLKKVEKFGGSYALRKPNGDAINVEEIPEAFVGLINAHLEKSLKDYDKE